MSKSGLGYHGTSPFTFLSFHPSFIQPLTAGHSIAFSHGGNIAIAFITQRIGGRKQSLHDIEATREFHLISLEATDGRIISAHLWPVPAGNLYVGATSDGNFVVWGDHGLRVYSPALEEMSRSHSSVSFFGNPDGRNMLVASDGGSIFVQGNVNSRQTLQMFSALDLRLTRSWAEPKQIVCASSQYLGAWGADGSFLLRGLDTGWRPILASASGCPPAPGHAEFIGKDTLVISRCGHVRVLKVDGTTLYDHQFPENQMVAGVWGSPDKRFIAIAVEKMAGMTIELLDMYRRPIPWRILIYDLKDDKLVGALRFGWQFAAAFSPDGPALAVLNANKGLLELYNVM